MEKKDRLIKKSYDEFFKEIRIEKIEVNDNIVIVDAGFVRIGNDTFHIIAYNKILEDIEKIIYEKMKVEKPST